VTSVSLSDANIYD